MQHGLYPFSQGLGGQEWGGVAAAGVARDLQIFVYIHATSMLESLQGGIILCLATHFELQPTKEGPGKGPGHGHLCTGCIRIHTCPIALVHNMSQHRDASPPGHLHKIRPTDVYCVVSPARGTKLCCEATAHHHHAAVYPALPHTSARPIRTLPTSNVSHFL